jgi:hypothetical protein
MIELPMHRDHWLVSAALVLLPLASFAQEEEEAWLSLKRLSLTVSGTYSYRPWNKLNESLTIVQDAVNYGTSIANPNGSAEKIIGDVSGQILLSYRVVNALAVNVFGGPTFTSSHTILESSSQKRTQDYRFNALGYGAGAEYHYAINDDLGLSINLGVERIKATLDFDYKLDFVGFGEFFPQSLRMRGLASGREFNFTPVSLCHGYRRHPVHVLLELAGQPVHAHQA